MFIDLLQLYVFIVSHLLSAILTVNFLVIPKSEARFLVHTHVRACTDYGDVLLPDGM